MTDLHFDAPQWLHLIWLIIGFIALLAWLENRGSQMLKRFISPSLQKHLINRVSLRRRILRLVFLFLSGLFLTLALMRPQWGLQFISTPRVGAEIMVCLDVSKSMLSEDVAPNRLERAKADLVDLLTYLDGDQVGLIAFAGRASVLSPITPDFGFLRQVLSQAGPHSVTRGGTRLEDPIRKAIAGFQNSDDVSRSILLITDGEDHDSFPLAAAKEAAERGIRILAIGFGDEAGSEIILTDPKTGVRTQLRDANNEIVITRLDGDLLREMALTSNGAYIPAGTGVLDLESIYQHHIAGLTRGHYDGQSHTIRNDAFQWAVLMGFIFFVAAILITSTSPTLPSTMVLTVLVMTLLTSYHQPAIAKTSEDKPLPVRTQYNQALKQVSQESFDEAEKNLQTLRSQAGNDGELRFRTSYNLGWIKVKQADKLLEEQPEKALEALQQASNWFSEAIRLRPQHTDSRYNLDIILRRIMALNDHLAKKDKNTIDSILQKLIDDQRQLLNQMRPALSIQSNSKGQSKNHRQTFRHFATIQLEQLSASQKLAEMADTEMTTINDKDEKEQTTEDKLRVNQLNNFLIYVHQASERMGQARSQMRRLQPKRAFRRVADALSELKRARDQLLDPIKRIDALLTEAGELSQLTAMQAAMYSIKTDNTDTQIDDTQKKQQLHVLASLRDWLTPEYLTESQEHLSLRTKELHDGLQAGLSQSQTTPLDQDDQQGEKPEEKAFLKQLEKAQPLLKNAHTLFHSAIALLEQQKAAEAQENQHTGINKLAQARELFLDLRQLIEVMYTTEQQIQSLISDQPEAPEVKNILPEQIDAIIKEQEKNLSRNVRIGVKIVDKLFSARQMAQEQEQEQQATAQNTQQNKPAVPQADAAAEIQRLEQADKFQQAINLSLNQSIMDLEQLAKDDSNIEQSRTTIAETIKQMEQLRKLFFSVIEHLKETLQRQQTLGDETEQIAAQNESDIDTSNAQTEGDTAEKRKAALGPIRLRQDTLSDFTGQIGKALEQQSQQPSPTQSNANKTNQANAQPDQTEQLKQAAQHVYTAQESMVDAAKKVLEEPLDTVREAQNKAVEELQNALKILQPPQQQKQKQEQQEQEQQEQEQSQQQEQEQSQQQEQNEPKKEDNDQLLQGIRDREAKRREEKNNKNKAKNPGYEAVEKDW